MRCLITFVAFLISAATLFAAAAVFEGPSLVAAPEMMATVAGDATVDPEDCKMCLDYDECSVCGSFFDPDLGIISVKCDSTAGAGHGVQTTFVDPNSCSAAKEGVPKDCGGMRWGYIGAGCDEKKKTKVSSACQRTWTTCTVHACSDPNLVCPKGVPTK